MIETILLNKKDFEDVVSGRKTFITGIMFSRDVLRPGDYIACNEWEPDSRTGRCCLAAVSAVEETEEFNIYAINPCRIDEHVRLTVPVYGEKKEGGSDDT